MKTIIIKLTSSSIKAGPFDISTEYGDVIASSVSRNSLIEGQSYIINDNVNVIILSSIGSCKTTKSFGITTTFPSEIASLQYTFTTNSCLWRHLTTPNLYNNFYGNIEPYIIEYPFSYKYNDEILQNVKDYTKVYKYFPDIDGIVDEADKIEIDNIYFNKSIIYNNQQSSGILELVSKPLNNLSAYLQYPIYNEFSKTITYTKADNFYKYNTFWNVVKDKTLPLFIRTCESLSIDKIINQENMQYTTRSFKKDPIRAKSLYIRHYLTDTSDYLLVSQFLTAPAMQSYI